jgi:hypothetical protein
VPDAPGFEDVRFRLEKKEPLHQLTKPVEDTDTHTLKASVCVAPDIQAGFDLAILETQPTGKSLMLNHECWKNFQKVDPDLQQTFEAKHRLWQQEVQKWRSSSKPEFRNAEYRLIFVAFRHPPASSRPLVTQRLLPRGLLKNLYSPTLSSLPQLMVDPPNSLPVDQE